jgi:hypothetical protein
MDSLIESTKISITLQYTYIITLYSRNVMKSIFIVMLILGVAAVLMIPTAPTQVVKATTAQCSASNSHGTVTQTKSGSCASSAFASLPVLSRGVVGGSQSSCKSGSVAVTPNGAAFSNQGFSSKGAVSCSSHSP